MKYFSFFFIVFLILSCNSESNYRNRYEKFVKRAQEKLLEEEFDSAYYFSNQAKLYSNTSDKAIYALLLAAEVQNKRSDFNGLEKTVVEALSLKRNSKYSEHLYNLLGIAYEEKKNFYLAVESYNKALILSSKEIDKVIIKNNIAVVYLEQGKYISAIITLKPLLKIDALKIDRKNYAKVLDNLGYAYFKKGQNNRANYFLNESLRIRDSLGEDYERIASLIHLARFYQDSLPNLTIDYAEKAYQVASSVNSSDDKLEALGILAFNADEERKKTYFQEYINLNDSIDFIQKTDKNQFAKIKYDYSIHLKDAEIHKTQKILYLLLFIIVVISSLYIFFYIRRKNKIQLQLENQKTTYETESRISKKLHDELANEVFQTLSFVQTQDLDNNRDTLVENLDKIYNKTRNISKDYSDIITGEGFEASFLSMITNFQDEKVNIIVKKEVEDWNQISDIKQIVLYKSILELLVNMKKYSQASLVLLHFNLEKEFKVKYSDNGVGFELKKGQGGLQNMENRIHGVNGTIIFDTMQGKGLKVSIVIPKK